RQAAKARFALAQRVLGVLALQELAEEAADRRRRIDEALVGLPVGVARERQHGDGAVLRHHGQRKGGEAPALAGGARRGARGARQIGRPHRPARLPQHARTAQQLFDLRFAPEPALRVAHVPIGLIDAVAAPAVPAFDVADEAQRRAQALRGGLRMSQRARDRMLELAQLVRALLLADVAADAAIALEDAFLVEQRLAAQRYPDDAPILGGVLHLEIAERLVPFELRAVALPVGIAE